METNQLGDFFIKAWDTATKSSMSSLEEGDRQKIETAGSWNDVQCHVIANKVPYEVSLIQPSLSHIRVFTDFFMVRLGVSLDVSTLWGSLARLLELTSEDLGRLGKIPGMIQDLFYKAEEFNNLFNGISETGNVAKEICFDMQLQYLEFFITSIKHIHGEVSDTGSDLIEKQYTSTKEKLSSYLARAQKLGGMNSSSGTNPPSDTDIVLKNSEFRCLMLPETKINRLFDRIKLFQTLDNLLEPADDEVSFNSVALYGLGGVGKTSVASSYIKGKFKQKTYDVVLWAKGEKPSSLRQSFTDIALRLKLGGAQAQSHDENLRRVQDWFQYTDSKWLIVYDNVESWDTIRPFWPELSQGKAIITTRDHSLAFESDSSGLEVTSWDEQTGSEYLLFLLRKRMGVDLESENNSALALSRRLSGHPLALSHMAGLIYSGESSIQEFTTMYSKNPRPTHATAELSRIWEYSFKSLDAQSRSLLGVMSFLMPDTVPQQLFEAGDSQGFPQDLQFCPDANTFSEVLRKLLKLALLKKDRNTRTLSIHRMIQTQYKNFLTPDERQRDFGNAVALINRVFPSYDSQQAQLYDVWEICNRYLQHIISLKDCFLEEIEIYESFKVPWKFCELLAQCQRYLYEVNLLVEFESVCDANLKALGTIENGPNKTDLEITTKTHRAQAAETLGDVERAIELNIEAYNMRLSENPRKKLLLCYTANNLGYCFNTANDHTSSLEWYNVSENWWRLLASDGQLEEAKELFDISLERLRTETPLNWAMLADGYFGLATLERRQKKFESAEAHYMDAQNVWLKGDQTRLHPFNGACMYKIGVCCLDQGKVEAAIKHIHDSMKVTKFHRSSMPIEHARNLFKLSEALLQDDQADKSAEARDEAEVVFKTRKPDAVRCDTESSYDDLIPIFWR
ncbi:hypothetical protein F5Y04DRAFT_276993 [Hypomontagnella monticulosa]|nr:hypothetical protein F5Y04DRAFT_276993 [Hypomontagnella monticulosa]